MSRSGYSDDCDGWALIQWRGAVASAIRGKKGQAFLREMAAAMDAMPEKSLIAHELKTDKGEVCALGSVAEARKLDVAVLDPDEHEEVASFFGIPHALACEIMYENDDGGICETPEQRWQRVRNWIDRNVTPDRPAYRGGEA